MNSLSADDYASFPLTLFDQLFERTTFLTGWLVEGTIDTDALATALAGVTKKWRMLSGRLESLQDEDNRWWNGADRRILLLPKDVLSFLVNSVRAELRGSSEGSNAAEVTTGDILVAWVLKTVYSQGTSPKSIIYCSNLASFRTVLAEDDPSILQYPHNAFVPLPYPSLTVAQLNSTSLPELSRTFALSRSALAISHVSSSYDAVVSATAFPASPDVHENMVVSNVSASRILESDWSAVGAVRTVCGYRYQLTPNELLMTNTVYIAGRLDDGSVVLDVSLNKARIDLLAKEVLTLKAAGEQVGSEMT
ncbi:hypothetical protein H0H87_003558 [Tephrocybe sp. NHM501043]|nr:hypothetical protein H0H87_003558 [Tephrocybe sp. NHM501043]